MSINKHFAHSERLRTLQDKNGSAVFEYIEKYELFLKEFNNEVKSGDYKKQIDILDDYLDLAKEHETEHEKQKPTGFLSSKTKYYSSILEELPALILSDKIDDLIVKYNLQNAKLHLGGLDCIIRIASNPNGTEFREKKRIDFALAVNASEEDKWVPLIGLEVKKYVDKTMFGTIIETYNSLHIFRPRTFYGFLVEDEARSLDVVVNSVMYKNEFILSKKNRSKTTRNRIDLEEYKRFVTQLHLIADESLQSLTIG